MTEEQVKSQYRAIHAPQNLRGQVLAACAAARRQRAGQRKKFASMAACLAVVLCLSVYGLSPVPAIASGGQTVDRGGVAVAAETVDLFGGTQTRTAAVFALEPEGGSEIETCISLAFARAAKVSVSEGMLYRLNPETGAADEAGQTCRASADELLYWQIPGDSAVLTARAGLRAVRIEAVRSGDGWSLSC